MSVLHHKKVIKSYKDRIRKKLDDVEQETNDIRDLLACKLSEFQQRTELLSNESDSKFLHAYRNLSKDLESYSEKLFTCLTTLIPDTAIEDEIENVVTDSSKEPDAVKSSNYNNHQNDGKIETEEAQSDMSSFSICTTNEKKAAGDDDLTKYSTVTRHNPENYIVNAVKIPENDDSRTTCYTNDKVLEANRAYPLRCEISGTAKCLSVQSSPVPWSAVSAFQDSSYFSSPSCDLNTLNKSETLLSKFSSDRNENILRNRSDSFSNLNAAVNQNRTCLSKKVYTTDVEHLNKIYHDEQCILQDIYMSDDDDQIFNSKINMQETGNSCKNISFPLVPVNSYIAAVITCIHSPSDFWMQLDDPATKKCCSFALPVKHNYQASVFHVNKYYLAPFKQTGLYHRVKILEIYPERMCARVFFIDYGNTENVCISQLQLLPDSAFAVPAQAIHCYLRGVAPVNETWSEVAIEKFKRTQEYSDFQTFIAEKYDNMFGVDLITKITLPEPEETISYNIGQMLCLDNLAVNLLNSAEDITSTKRNDSKKIMTKSVPSDDNVLYSQNKESHFESQSKCGVQMMKSTVDTAYSENLNTYSDSAHNCTLNYKEIRNPKKSKLNQFTENSFSLKCNEIYTPEEKIPEIENENVEEEKNDFLLSNESNDSCIILSSSEEISENCITSKVNVVTSDNLESQEISLSFPFHWNAKIPMPEIDFEENKMVLVMVSNVYSPSEFYVNIASENVAELDDLREQMTTFYDNIKLSNKFQNCGSMVQKNMYCSCWYEEDSNWYRAQVLDICCPSEGYNNPILVRYVDYGNKVIAEADHIQPLTDEFAKYPAFAIHCSLAYIKPHNSDDLRDDKSFGNGMTNGSLVIWPENAVKSFKNLISYEKCYTAQIVNVNQVSNKNMIYEVCLWDTQDSCDLLINRLLIENGVADIDSNVLKNIDPSILEDINPEVSDTGNSDSLNEWDPMTDDFKSPLNSYGVNLDDAEIATLGYKRKDEQYVCKFFNMYGRCRKGENCPYKHILIDYDETNDKIDIYSLDNTIKIEETSFYTLVQVSTVIHPGHFFVIFPYGPKPLGEIEDSAKSAGGSEQFHQLILDMSAYYSESCFDENTMIAPACGTIVAARSKFNNRWYRGRIITVEDIMAPVKVFFVDFGNSEWIERRYVREMHPPFLELPFQAVECFLSNIEPKNFEKGQSWSNEARKCFVDLIKDKILIAYIDDKTDTDLQVTLTAASENQKLVINDYLVKENFAQYKQPLVKISCAVEQGDTKQKFQPG